MARYLVNALIHLNVWVEIEAASADEAARQADEALQREHPNAALVDVVDWREVW